MHKHYHSNPSSISTAASSRPPQSTGFAFYFIALWLVKIFSAEIPCIILGRFAEPKRTVSVRLHQYRSNMASHKDVFRQLKIYLT
jgi:hypothetical protein